MISKQYMVRYTPQKFEEVEEIVWSVMSCDETSANVIVKNDDIIITAYYEDEYLHNVCEQNLLRRIKGLKIKGGEKMAAAYDTIIDGIAYKEVVLADGETAMLKPVGIVMNDAIKLVDDL